MSYPHTRSAGSEASGLRDLDTGSTNLVPRDELEGTTDLVRVADLAADDLDGPTTIDRDDTGRIVEFLGGTDDTRPNLTRSKRPNLTHSKREPASSKSTRATNTTPLQIPAARPPSSHAEKPRRLATGTIDGAPPVPRTMGGYKVTDLIASGGMGVVYRGEHPTRKPVAIKAMNPQLQKNPAVAARFFSESVATSRIRHPNVVRFFDFGYDKQGVAYLLMELLEGETLSSRLVRERRLDVAMAVDIAIQVCLGLGAAHEQGVVHRDVKPDNIFLCKPEGARSPTVKLLDFGVAKVEGQGAQQTWQGDLLGTPCYMAPEQGLSASDSDARSDLYSVGCILFEMVCGVVPFTGNLVETLLAHQTSERPAARTFNPDVPPELEALLARLMALDPADRPQSVADMVCELTTIKVTLAGATRAIGKLPRAGTEIVRHTTSTDGRRSRWRLRVLIAIALTFGITVGALIALRHIGRDAAVAAHKTK